MSQSASKTTPNLAKKLLLLHKTNPQFTEHHLTDMTLTHFGAGLETLGITLSAFLCNIIQRPQLQARIQHELDTAWRDGRLIFSSDGVLKVGQMKEELPFLEACLRESMRLHPVIGVAFPRIVGPEGLMVDAVMIPEGVSAMVLSIMLID
jgi:cytochrome P450